MDNIFNPPLSRGQFLMEKRLTENRGKNKKEATVLLAVSGAVLLLYAVFFLVPQVQLYLETPAKIRDLQDQVQKYDQDVLPVLEKEKTLKKAAYDENTQKEQMAVNEIFPATQDKLGVVKRLENFATLIDAKNPPFDLDSISFNAPVEGEQTMILPISTSIKSSRANFERFLELIDLSGRFDSEVPVRLMEISNINLRYNGIDPATGKDRGVDFSVELNAYSRKS